MQPGSNPSLRLILAHLEHPTGRLDLSPDAPPGNKGSSERRISKVDREGVVQRPAGSRGRHSPTVRAAVLVEPIGHLRVPLPETFWWYGDPDAYGEAAFRQGDHSAWVARHLCSLFVLGHGSHTPVPQCPAAWGCSGTARLGMRSITRGARGVLGAAEVRDAGQGFSL